MHNGDLFRDPAGNGKAVEKVLDNVKVIGQIPDLLVHVKGLGEEIDHVPVLALVLKIDLYVFREGLEIPVVPDHTDLINQDQGIRRELTFSEIFNIIQIAARDLAVTVYALSLFLVL